MKVNSSAIVSPRSTQAGDFLHTVIGHTVKMLSGFFFWRDDYKWEDFT